MTIYESLSNKLFIAKIMGFVFWLAFSLTIFLPLDKAYFLVSLVPFIGFGAIVVYILFLIQCPKCKSSIGRASMRGVSLFKRDIKLNRCPCCDADFNSAQ